ncbi:30S ribosomal protein S1 [Lujinxingia litoralis]|uniref:30S ribosomal protein S1 n=1 Tax=Lujinxingia litoralis TaxID=2211119 RepID=A0A328C635_9DELT|nr:S1 RNA-binding domain-containing protein [Lujinxingia litoralis]RAL20776.1 30S ribosomal protein S1 [Lujinxingia litoralis]
MASNDSKNNKSNKPADQAVPPRARKKQPDASARGDSPDRKIEVIRAPQAPKAPNAPQKEAPKQEAPGATKKEEPEASGMTFADTSATMDDFAAMFEGHQAATPSRKRFDVGDQIEGTVITVGSSSIFVQIGANQEGVAERAAYEDDEGNVTLVPGQTYSFYVLGFKGGIQLGKELGAGRQGLVAVETAHDTGLPISGRVTGTNKGGFEVDLAGVEAFCPISQIELGFTEEPDAHVGQTYSFKVQEVRDGGRTVVVSRRALLEEQQKEAREETLKTLEVGQVLDGIITRVADFGAFVDIGGLEGLVHVSELSHTFFDHPTDLVKVGQEVKVEVLSIEEPVRNKPIRIGLSMKATEQDPWLDVNEKFSVGSRVLGRVVRIAPFGAFVEIAPGVEGLVHVSQMSWERHVANPADVVTVGEEVSVEVQDIDLLRRRIGLSMKAAEGDPWSAIDERFTIGMEVQGNVARVEDFGAFIELGGGITALLPRSEMNLSEGGTPHRQFTAGQDITARVLNIEPERRRMALSLKDAATIAEQTDPSKAAPTSYQDDSLSSGGSMGTLGDLLKARNKK